jgi:hypothetical protein
VSTVIEDVLGRESKEAACPEATDPHRMPACVRQSSEQSCPALRCPALPCLCTQPFPLPATFDVKLRVGARGGWGMVSQVP